MEAMTPKTFSKDFWVFYVLLGVLLIALVYRLVKA